jgi:transcriptional regulator with XRE-family HTH domain
MVAEYKSNNIKALMQKHELTIESLAQELNLSVSTINRLLVSSKSDPKLSTLRPIAKFFRISIDELIGDRPLSLKPGDSESGFDNKHALIQVPIIHWEQVKDAIKIISSLNFHTWNNWAAASDLAGEHSYALRVKQSSLPAPFYFKSLIVIDPERTPGDSDHVVVIHDDNPMICKIIFHGVKKIYKPLSIDETLKDSEIRFAGTIIQCTTEFDEKEMI